MDRHERTQIVRTYECDGLLNLRPETILRWIQDVAEEHASRMGFGYDMCRKTGMAWVELKLYIKIHKTPRWKDCITIITWDYQLSSVIAAREFEMKDQAGNIVIEASTQWALIDTKRRRPAALRKYLNYPTHNKAEPSANQKKLEPLPEIEQPEAAASFKAQHHTIDFNQHVNNSAYLVWALDTLDAHLRNKTISEIRIDFKKESMSGDMIRIYSENKKAHCLFSIQGEDSEHARLRIDFPA